MKTLYTNAVSIKGDKVKGGYGNLRGFNEPDGTFHAKKQVESAYTMAGLREAGFIKIKGSAIEITDKEMAIADVQALFNDTMPRYWLSNGWAHAGYDTVADTPTWRLTAMAKTVLTKRLGYNAPGYNTTRRALQLIAGIMRTGKTPVDFGYKPHAIKIP